VVNEEIDRSRERELIAKVPPGAFFEHFKGKKYKILGVGRYSETLGMCVIYQLLYDSPEFGDHAEWVRPLEMFLGNVVVNGKEMPRFRLMVEDNR
jgi:hypothetical protein